MARLAAPFLLLAGCLSIPPPLSDGGPDDRDGAEGQTADALDAGTGSDAPFASHGSYHLDWTRTGGSCSTITLAADTFDAGDDFGTYRSIECPPAGLAERPAVWQGDTLVVDATADLYSCDRSTFDRLPMHSLVFDGQVFDGDMTANRYTATLTFVCSLSYHLHGSTL